MKRLAMTANKCMRCTKSPIYLLPILFSIAGCTATQPMHVNSNARMTAEEFRHLYPLDMKVTKDILADYEHVQSSILAASVKGGEAYVSLLTAAGSFHVGRDLYYSQPPRIKEVRDNYAAVQAGDKVCVQKPRESASCSAAHGPLHLGLPNVPYDHIARIWSRDIPCDDQLGCRYIKIQLSSAESDLNSMEGFSADPELVGHDYELAFTLSNYLPVYWKTTDRYHVGVTATGFYFNHRFGKTTETVELPVDGGTIDHLDMGSE